MRKFWVTILHIVAQSDPSDKECDSGFTGFVVCGEDGG